MKNFLLLISALSVCLFSCDKSSNPPPNSALVMYVNGCVSGSTQINVDGKSNNATVNGAANIAFGKTSGYQFIPAAANDSLSFYVTGLNYLTGGIANLTANAHYTVFAGGAITAPVTVIVSDDLSTPASGNAKVRFVNISPDMLNESCYIGTTKIDSNIGFKSVTPFYQIAATTTNVSMIDLTSPTKVPVTPLNAQVFTAGKIYTVMLTGTYTGSGASVLTYTVINNN